MSPNNLITSQIYLKLDGSPIAQVVAEKIAEVLVEQHVYIPNSFTIRLRDPDLELLDEGPFELTKEVEIEAETVNGDKVLLMEGEITALEPDFGENMTAELVVRGYDRSHRLYRETKSRAFVNQTDSDLAQQIAQEHDLEADIEGSPTVYEHIFQANVSDLVFLRQRAQRMGYVCYVAKQTLHFHPPRLNDPLVTLTWGQDLIAFRPRMTLADQVAEVVVRGWDVEKQTPILGQAKQGNFYPAIQESKNGAEWAAVFSPGKRIVVHQPPISQAEADLLAAAHLDALSGQFITATGLAYRRPDIRAGEAVTIEALGKRLSGDYWVTSTRHIYNETGLRTHFSVTGANTGLLRDQLRTPSASSGWVSVAPGVVTNANDPHGWGRVKVKFPWMTEEAESDWARVVGNGVGPEAGLCAIPDVGHEVLVAFAQGDISQPYVLGGLWNGQHALPPEVANTAEGEAPQVRSWRSLAGHTITLHDKERKIMIKTADGHLLTLDDSENSLTIESKGDLNIKAGGALTIQSTQDLTLESTSGKLNGKSTQDMTLESSTNMNIKGTLIKLN